MKKKEKDLEKTDIIDSKEELPDDEADITRNINLDDLYDGAVNNTILLDPVTKDEVLISNRKSNNMILGIFLAIIILLGLYYVYNKSDLFTSDKPVTSKPTTTAPVVVNNDSGKLICSYQSKSDNETEEATYTFNYQNNKIYK